MTSSKIAENLTRLNEAIHNAATKANRDINNIRLVAVSKKFPIEAIREALAAGHNLFGENYVQELQEKAPPLKNQCAFHFIGHLQSNKVKPVAENCRMIETVDRLKLAQRLENHLQSLHRKIDGLIQVNIGREPQKSGVHPENLEKLFKQMTEFEHLRVCGLMTIPPYNESAEASRPYFRELRQLAEKMQARGHFSKNEAPELSMGMSGDFHIAIEEGATIIRVGTAIFGARDF